MGGLFGKLFGKVLIGVITLYRLFVSPLLGTNCRFQPSCSAYGIEAITRHGALKGRLADCQANQQMPSMGRIWL